jgi:hypothetical protein
MPIFILDMSMELAVAAAALVVAVEAGIAMVDVPISIVC